MKDRSKKILAKEFLILISTGIIVLLIYLCLLGFNKYNYRKKDRAIQEILLLIQVKENDNNFLNASIPIVNRTIKEKKAFSQVQKEYRNDVLLSLLDIKSNIDTSNFYNSLQSDSLYLTRVYTELKEAYGENFYRTFIEFGFLTGFYKIDDNLIQKKRKELSVTEKTIKLKEHYLYFNGAPIPEIIKFLSFLLLIIIYPIRLVLLGTIWSIKILKSK